MEKSKETVGQNGFRTGDLWATSPDLYKLIYPVPGWWLSQYNNFIFYIFFCRGGASQMPQYLTYHVTNTVSNKLQR